jgi:hypothetical protein
MQKRGIIPPIDGFDCLAYAEGILEEMTKTL